jgi:hypothetical protein
MDGITIYSMPAMPPRWDRIGVFYITFCAAWTLLVACGMAFCLLHRRHLILRHRPLVLSFVAIGMLHSYWIMAQLVYPIGGTMPVVVAYDVQYFVMGTYFPLGIALFHAANTRFMHVARLQRQFTHPALDMARHRGCDGRDSSWLCRIRNIPTLTKIMVAIGFGMVLQTLLTVIMWLACAKYHPEFGIPGTQIKGDTFPEQLEDLGRGWEWWPSLAWQIIWAWIVAPIILYRAWGIRDTMGWRTQTIGCCLSSLHAAPMFVIALYVPAFAPVNAYYAPSQWIHLSTMCWEIFTVFVPAFQVARSLLLAKNKPRTGTPTGEWEATSQTAIRVTSEWNSSEKGTDANTSHGLLTMRALEHVLEENPAPLQEFSALRDFSGENIAFLTRVAAWKAGFDVEHMSNSYNQALALYADFISPRDAQFPLNLPSHDLKELEGVFEAATRAVYGEARVDTATPFTTEEQPGLRHDNPPDYMGNIPSEFSPFVFDHAQSHVKYLVLTNTWPKFVAFRNRPGSIGTARTSSTGFSETTLVSQVSSQLSKLFKKQSR